MNYYMRHRQSTWHELRRGFTFFTWRALSLFHQSTLRIYLNSEEGFAVQVGWFSSSIHQPSTLHINSLQDLNSEEALHSKWGVLSFLHPRCSTWAFGREVWDPRRTSARRCGSRPGQGEGREFLVIKELMTGWDWIGLDWRGRIDPWSLHL